MLRNQPNSPRFDATFGLWVGLLLALVLVPAGPALSLQEPGAGAMDPATGALRPPEVPFPHRFGVAHILPRYKPGGRLGPDILIEGARDAYGLGFRTIKISLGEEILLPNTRSYALPPEMLSDVQSLVDFADLEPFRQLFAMPFQTYFINVDVIGPGSVHDLRAHPPEGAPAVADPPLSEPARQNIYEQVHQLATHLLTRYRGSQKVFILQNHEADWHILPQADMELDPSETALANLRTYLELRQQAVNDARRQVGATDVYLYHMVEVNLVKKAMQGGRTATNNVLPHLRCDLVGYSAWDSNANGQILEALDYLRSRSQPSFAFGRNNVLISEHGVAEQKSPERICLALDAYLQAIVSGVPWAIHWTLYDNESFATVDGKRVLVDNPDASQCAGLWVRRPDGTLGRIFRGYQPYLDPAGLLNPEPTDATAYAAQLYRSTLGREPDPAALADAVARIEAQPWAKEELFKRVLALPEYRERTWGCSAPVVVDAYRVLLGRPPESLQAPTLASAALHTDAGRFAYIDTILQSDESRRRFIDWLFRRHLGRPPQAAELDAWLNELNVGKPRQTVYEVFVAGLPRP
ncbi:hypothetical protein BH23PLA1_BH23PLA1_23950 [soil metagenome]